MAAQQLQKQLGLTPSSSKHSGAESPSAAELALALYIAFWTAPDLGRLMMRINMLIRLMRASNGLSYGHDRPVQAWQASWRVAAAQALQRVASQLPCTALSQTGACLDTCILLGPHFVVNVAYCRG